MVKGCIGELLAVKGFRVRTCSVCISPGKQHRVAMLVPSRSGDGPLAELFVKHFPYIPNQ